MNNQQRFEEYCKSISEVHPEFKYFKYQARSHVIFPWKSKLESTKANYFSFSSFCPDFGPDDLTYEVNPEYVWKEPKEGQTNMKVLFSYGGVWFKGIVIGWYLGRAIFFENEDSILLVSPNRLVLADPDNPNRKPDDNWRPE